MQKYGYLAAPEFVPGRPRDDDNFRTSFEVYADGREVCLECRQAREEIKMSNELYPDESRKPAVDNTLGRDIDVLGVLR